MRVLITGGAGYLGRGILRRVCFPPPGGAQLGWPDLSDWEVTCFSRDETKQDECHRRYPNAHYVLGDVRDLSRLTNVMYGHDWVIHTAALKYVPEAELNAAECVSVNVDGSRNVIEAAKAAGIKQVVGISTDKACQPVNIYGASKMVMERLFADEALLQERAGRDDGPGFKCVRYGNVIGSTGSVIPLFARQYAETGRVRITNPHMTRFWMPVDEAIDLIVLALERAHPGSVVVPFTRAMRIEDVARAATVDDVPMDIIGERPGEKAHELLVHHEESVRVIPLLVAGKEVAWELRRPGSTPNGREAFTLASHAPNRLMSVVDMRGYIKDAATI